MYITSYDALQRALSDRACRREEIRDRVNSFVQSTYGIETMTGILPKFFSFLEKEEPVGFLARQIASVCIEDIAFQVGVHSLGLQPVTAPFGRDSFTSKNHDKLHRIKIPWISWSKKGNMVLAHERACTRNSEELEGVPLDKIVCHDGSILPDFHTNLRKKACLIESTSDVSLLHSYMLAQARNRPRFVYRETANREEKVALVEGAIVEARDRPPASWYYPYYLSWFVDGSMVLFETYDNPLAEVPHAKMLFEKAMSHVAIGTGFMPLVVKIPPLSKEMLYCNRHMLEGNRVQAIAEQAIRVDKADTVVFFQSIAESVTRFN